ncbi:phosphoribosylformylglycinamidine synthase [Geosporobacter ferrireducens]|uniref:Phosphoribosylformylglycinamidine synthase n=1 Tax=Geosporobacter ferrireducens TaxID=1424294 RepID=A0A1D8GG77_9FIRM|nr:phosphoribosylformylglycinamidine synthase [Geosporobacter ferrireducens]AOT69887.1 phosphoribosylformylglycinamidine synthase [Geosporobacter ferrireducens]MTI54417.1 phosphoribosylformylglycinamidine synthase [Geosporobacter ferrireducens]
MKQKVRRIFVEKKKGLDIEAQHLLADLKENLGMKALENLRIVNRYDIAGIGEEAFQKARNTIFSEPPVDEVVDEVLEIGENIRCFAVEYLPGQYDQRADSGAQCIQILTQQERPDVVSAKVILLEGDLSQADFEKIKNYCINPVDSREASMEKPETVEMMVPIPGDVAVLEGFIHMDPAALRSYREEMGFAMSEEDLAFVQGYFRDQEKRNPTITEIKVIDTYWSDHCRHTTFLTKIESVEIQEGNFTEPVKKAYETYLAARERVYRDTERDISLMDIAVIGMKELRKAGKLEDLDVSDEINACSIEIDADVEGQKEKWLLMFKNETHNHPTEIEPFGGAATCLGGAIRDPLSGRTYVYQAMRVTGSGDPRAKIEETLSGKLPQRKITTGAAAGYSAYGNQIGLATGQVAELYDEAFVAKRMEVGAVIAAAPKANVVREKPKKGDIVILLGGKTGRDGCGGATGSSKEHTEESIFTCGAEVQKGNAPTERKIQRLFRNPEVSRLIKKCNDFGAGGVSVAIGELTDGLMIDLDRVPKKYEGLDGTELAISESQERMAVVVAADQANTFIQLAAEENLEAVVVAWVTDDRRMKMQWREKTIVDLSRDFLDTNGVKQHTRVYVEVPEEKQNYFKQLPAAVEKHKQDVVEAWLANLQDINVCSQRGLVERFDSTIGAGTVLMPFGGKYQTTPAEGMAAKIPVLTGDTTTGSLMSFGYNPKIGKWSPFHGALYAVVEAVAKIVAMGGNHKTIRLTFQEYFEKLGKEPSKWGKPFSALLGAYMVQHGLGIPAIGGKDSMSGTFKDLNVPPTLVAFAVATEDVRKVISPEFKEWGSQVVWIPIERDAQEMPNFQTIDQIYGKITECIHKGKVLAAHSVRQGGLAAAISKMCFGNQIGLRFEAHMDAETLFTPHYGSIILELPKNEAVKALLADIPYRVLGSTTADRIISFNDDTSISLEEALKAWEAPLEKIFPTKTASIQGTAQQISYADRSRCKPAVRIAKPRVFIPAFPGTNCEVDSARAFEKAGGKVETFVFRNLSASDIENSIAKMAEAIEQAQIIMLPGGFSAGDEPDGSGKFIATVFRNPRIKEAVMELLQKRDGLMLGICNGFQALVKLGLLPYGEIFDIHEDCPTLTFNRIGRHASRMVETRVASTLSPWFANLQVGDIHRIAVSHGEGRFVAKAEVLEEMIQRGQIATQYVDPSGNASYDIAYNPNGSVHAVEGITSPDGRILGKMGHSERTGSNIAVNVPGEKDQQIFRAGIDYFR